MLSAATAVNDMVSERAGKHATFPLGKTTLQRGDDTNPRMMATVKEDISLFILIVFSVNLQRAAIPRPLVYYRARPLLLLHSSSEGG
ncbi:hypothetical protein TGRH88_076920 [Toxoplasma gondii]|uniref:Uncharacterized protein n=1 Tax=Toxoplasma gondii TaxID=5811 RepID=A0A7J6K4X0_TOXGO|nr:hypothetical protein TGRH88_076920 [Toxoplasma gondii]